MKTNNKSQRPVKKWKRIAAVVLAVGLLAGSVHMPGDTASAGAASGSTNPLSGKTLTEYANLFDDMSDSQIRSTVSTCITIDEAKKITKTSAETGANPVIYYDFKGNIIAGVEVFGRYASSLAPSGMKQEDTFVYATTFNLNNSDAAAFFAFRAPEANHFISMQSGVRIQSGKVTLSLLGAELEAAEGRSYRDNNDHMLVIKSSPDKVSVWIDDTLIFDQVEYSVKKMAEKGTGDNATADNGDGSYTMTQRELTISNTALYPVFGFYLGNGTAGTISEPFLAVCEEADEDYENYFDNITPGKVLIHNNGSYPKAFTVKKDLNEHVRFTYDTVHNTTNGTDRESSDDILYYDFRNNAVRWDGLGYFADQLGPTELSASDTFVYEMDFSISKDSVNGIWMTFRTPKNPPNIKDDETNTMVNQSGVQFTGNGVYLRLLGASLAQPYTVTNYRDGITHTLKIQSAPDRVSVWIDDTLLFDNVDYDLDAVVAANDPNGQITKKDDGTYLYREKWNYSNSTLYPAFGFYVSTVDLTISNPLLYNYDYEQAKHADLLLTDADHVDFTYDYKQDGQFTVPFNTQIFPGNITYREDFNEINMRATMTYSERTSSNNSMMSGFYLGSATRHIEGDSATGIARIYLGYLPHTGEILLFDVNYGFAISSGGNVGNALPAVTDMDNVPITYQMNYNKSTDTLSFQASAEGKSYKCKFSNITSIIAAGRLTYSYTDFQFHFGWGHERYNGEDSIVVSDVRVWGDIDVNDVLAVGGGESSYPIMCSVKEGDVLPTGEYLEQTISVEDQLYQVRHYVKAWKDADGNPVTSYEAGKTYTPEYIDTKMLDVRVQYKKDTVNSTDTEEKVIARFIGSVDKLEGYKETGFILSTKERDLDFGKGYKECTGINTVYEGLYENVNGVSAYKSAEELYDTYSDYIFAYDIGNLPAGQKVYARAYVRLSDGTTVLGNVRKILVSGGNLEALRAKINGKTLSVLGDSISTYTGYSNDAANTNSTIGGNAICYDGSYILTDVNDTWWMSTVNETGMKLLVNNSWSGDKISLRGKERALQLHDDTGENAGTEPDIIAVYLGINDINGKSTLVDFRINYTEMISGMAEKYKNADVFLFTHVPNRGMGVSVSELEAYNAVIEEVADTYGCTVVDLYNESGMTLATCDRYTGDGLHPNAEGMELIMNVFIDALTEKYK